jgi:hypothetical protein
MTWITFDENYDYPIPGKRAWIAYKKGSTYNVPTQVELIAIASGKAHKVKPTRKTRNARRS